MPWVTGHPASAAEPGPDRGLHASALLKVKCMVILLLASSAYHLGA